MGRQHPDVASSYNNLASVLGDQGDMKKGKEYHERYLAIMEETLGSQHPDVASSYNNLANVLRKQCELREANEDHEHAKTFGASTS